MGKIIEIINRIIEVIIGLRRNLAMAIASVVLIFLTFFILGFSVIITENVKKLSADVIESLSVYVYVDPDATSQEVQTLISDIQNLDGVNTVALSNKEEQLDNITKIWGDDGDTFKEYFSGDKNPLNDVLIVEAEDEDVDLNNLTIQIQAMPGIESASYGEGEGADQLIKTLKNIQVVASIVTLIFAFITVFLIINTIKLTINSRRKEIEIMRLVGASKMYIIFPFAVEGIILGLIGGTLAFFTTYFVYKGFFENLKMFATVVVPPAAVKMSLIQSQILFAVIIGLVSSIIAIRSYLKV